MAVRVSTAENLDTYRETAHNRDKEVGEEVNRVNFENRGGERGGRGGRYGGRGGRSGGRGERRLSNQDRAPRQDFEDDFDEEIDGCDAFDRFHIYTYILLYKLMIQFKLSSTRIYCLHLFSCITKGEFNEDQICL